jgi:hypothetical protein
VTGSRLYVIDGLQFKIIDVSNPMAPLLLNSTNSLGAQGLHTTASMAYLASPDVNPTTNKGGLYVVDVSVPTSPVVLTNCYSGFDNAGVAVSGSLGVATGNTLGMKVVDITNPLAPETIGSLTGTMKGVDMAGQFAYVLQIIPGNPSHTDLAVVDLSVPASPAVVGRVTVTTSIYVGVKIVGSLAYVAAGSSGLQIVDVSNPYAPQVIGAIDTPGTAYAVDVANGYAYVSDSTSIQVINVTNPGSPFIVGSLTTSSAKALSVTGSRLYVIDGLQFKIIDVSNPTTPLLLSSWDSLGAQAVDSSGTLVFLVTPALNHSDAKGGAYILEVSNPAQVTLIEQIIVPGTTRSVTNANGYVYTGDSAAIIDVIQLGP